MSDPDQELEPGVPQPEGDPSHVLSEEDWAKVVDLAAELDKAPE